MNCLNTNISYLKLDSIRKLDTEGAREKETEKVETREGEDEGKEIILLIKSRDWNC